MRAKDRTALERAFTAALDAVVDQARADRSILAAILCGSLAHDTVWAKSDVDLVLVTADDPDVERARGRGRALYAGDVNIHVLLMTRTEFRKTVEGAIRNSFMHSFLAKGRVLYSHDPTIAALMTRLAGIGERDTALELLHAATSALACVYKARKFLVTRGDLEYTALWILYAATPLARIEVLGRRLLADREVIPQALALNPPFFTTIYTDLLNTKKTRTRVEAALDAADRYIFERAQALFAPILDHLREVGEARSASELEAHFERHFGIEGVTTACEYLADISLMGRASAPLRLTRRSNVDVQELAFYALS